MTHITMQITCEPCRRLVAAGGLPDRAGQPTQIQLHLTLDQLRRLDSAAGSEQPNHLKAEDHAAAAAHNPHHDGRKAEDRAAPRRDEPR